VGAIKRKLSALAARLSGNVALDQGQAKRLADHERRIQALERRVEQRVKTLDAEE